jgi:hypothetical protein
MAQTDVLHYSEREHIAMLLVTQYPFLKGSFGTGHVSILESRSMKCMFEIEY